jgi:hypothetical protein
MAMSGWLNDPMSTYVNSAPGTHLRRDWVDPRASLKTVPLNGIEQILKRRAYSLFGKRYVITVQQAAYLSH